MVRTKAPANNNCQLFQHLHPAAGMPPRKVQKSSVIRDVDYLLSLSYSESSSEERDILVMDALNRFTQCCWRGIFDRDTVVRLTSQAGSLRTFAAFSAMLKAAILRTSKSVCLDVIAPDYFAQQKAGQLTGGGLLSSM